MDDIVIAVLCVASSEVLYDIYNDKNDVCIVTALIFNCDLYDVRKRLYQSDVIRLLCKIHDVTPHDSFLGFIREYDRKFNFNGSSLNYLSVRWKDVYNTAYEALHVVHPSEEYMDYILESEMLTHSSNHLSTVVSRLNCDERVALKYNGPITINNRVIYKCSAYGALAKGLSIDWYDRKANLNPYSIVGNKRWDLYKPGDNVNVYIAAVFNNNDSLISDLLNGALEGIEGLDLRIPTIDEVFTWMGTSYISQILPESIISITLMDSIPFMKWLEYTGQYMFSSVLYERLYEVGFRFEGVYNICALMTRYRHGLPVDDYSNYTVRTPYSNRLSALRWIHEVYGLSLRDDVNESISVCCDHSYHPDHESLIYWLEVYPDLKVIYGDRICLQLPEGSPIRRWMSSK